MLGVVLCGGESRRMGSDKGLLRAGNEVWAERTAAKLRDLGIPVVLSINPAQVEPYSRLFPRDQLIVDSAEAKGPLKGLLSIHRAYPGEDVLLLACDMIDMDTDTLRVLKLAFEEEPGSFDFYVYEFGNFIEPLCAVYPARTLRTLNDKLLSGTLVGFSLQRIIGDSNRMCIRTGNSCRFGNYNSSNPYA